MTMALTPARLRGLLPASLGGLRRSQRFRRFAMFALAFTLSVEFASAGPNYSHGRISNVTFADDYVMVMLDSGLPDNCVGTPWDG